VVVGGLDQEDRPIKVGDRPAHEGVQALQARIELLQPQIRPFQLRIGLLQQRIKPLQLQLSALQQRLRLFQLRMTSIRGVMGAVPMLLIPVEMPLQPAGTARQLAGTLLELPHKRHSLNEMQKVHLPLHFHSLPDRFHLLPDHFHSRSDCFHPTSGDIHRMPPERDPAPGSSCLRSGPLRRKPWSFGRWSPEHWGWSEGFWLRSREFLPAPLCSGPH